MSSLVRLGSRLHRIPKRLLGTAAAKSYNAGKRRGVVAVTAACAIGSAAAVYAASRTGKLEAANAAKQPKQEQKGPVSGKLAYREQRFIKFASVELDGQVYMTPQDFLESVLDQEPRPRLKRRQLSEADVVAFREATPPLHAGSPAMFRTARDRGLISYTEYLFLLSVLIKPRSGFLIAFNMFDTDGNRRVDKSEFHIIEDIFIQTWRGKKQQFWRVNGNNNNNFRRRQASQEGHSQDDSSSGHAVDTFLTVHFFGKSGREVLRYEDFEKFMENLQKEVVELEFHEFSKGADRISEMDFAKILLRYTYLDSAECKAYLDRLLLRIKEEKGIGFDEFWAFCQFLNNIDDFTVAVNMFNVVGRPVAEQEFFRAVKICGGAGVSRHLVHTVFQIFDVDGDGRLSQREFVAIMKDRLRRRFKAQPTREKWESFKACIKNEMKTMV
ncbi:calcium uptake protein 3, mitochondrial-like [Schistocerca nitens]|uniref:calcium uptake protein 3, mitochondrial-like n=1 Tax=Schistocerca nitens TaxID=7011 RepID=UPI0021177887|nr:calcium uptake protein 3, mitochondrial-like [Schistocerca nitens]XP_049809120.1 calcium uptake protein 3, mitochondrial-like [Schistocerca nitens]XP_049809121.1 calcium uptake protein 3, mitochondrial-like [Schistocerca nitens]XP_049809122.1 calcium uptake protein 3, mitochondrial-like [Schistocerca nitens]XP_049809123.1 calcium uptake protein 3, mitochondrial-like [Schistocerca nitens]XP_049809124.1 calcium uptake protein 3, mitochondrial-like [Schistocerca nitens]